jgi:hypothetical protein
MRNVPQITAFFFMFMKVLVLVVLAALKLEKIGYCVIIQHYLYLQVNLCDVSHFLEK